MTQDQAYSSSLQQDPQKSIKKGFFWIGIASTISQILSAVTMFIVMFFITKEEMGTATLAVTFSVLFEALNSLGTHQAILQTKDLTPNETHSVFWFATGFAILLYIVALPLAWVSASFYDNALLIPLIIFAMIKLPVVSIAAIPLQLVNRRFEYKKISAIQSFTTIACSLIKITLAVCGAGAWSIVIGETLYGFGTLTGAFAYSKYIPKCHFKFSECRRFIKFGYKTTLESLLSQLNKNLHYLIIGKFLGEGVLGIYRIAYELAMTPALALLNVVSKSSFPVFSRLQNQREKLSQLFLWNQKILAIFAAIPTAFILFTATDLFSFMSNKDWQLATPIIPFVLALSFFKSLLQTYPELYRACGNPHWSIVFQISETAGVLVLGSAALAFLPIRYSLFAMLSLWLATLIAMFIPSNIAANKLIHTNAVQSLQSIAHGVAFFAIAAALSILPWKFQSLLPFPNVSHIVLETLAIFAAIAIYARFILKIHIRDFFKTQKNSNVSTG